MTKKIIHQDEMATPISFNPQTLQLPIVAALAGGVGTLMTSYGDGVSNIFGVNIPAPIYVALAVGVSSFIVVANSAYLLPWIGVTDPTTYTALYFATPLVTGASAVAFDAIINLINGDGMTSGSNMLTLFIIGAVAGMIGQWSVGMDKESSKY